MNEAVDTAPHARNTACLLVVGQQWRRGHTIPIRSNSELAQLFDQEDVTHLNDVYSGR